ncbi:hypothetical protein QQS21_002150 [Conoideocrella luteorostrata]|uniref:Fringe-like glycosyltransferase domain-containing protein n=1 Tax=Conoideocrella luteorostrata TaxID=1105319 RepID=A0AAJ0CYD4_9HYPO|nr:hypothetical protein QQS21_002150 [Conoideocrella luteorostrata]
MAIRQGRTKRAIVLVVYVSVILLLLFNIGLLPGSRSFYSERPFTQSPRASQVSEPTEKDKDDPSSCRTTDTRLLELQRRHELQETFQYARRLMCITRNQEFQRASITKLSQRLLKQDFQVIRNTRQPKPKRISCPEAIDIPVSASPFPQNVDASDFTFAVSTTYERFVESATILLNDWSFWLTNGSGRSNGAKFIVMLLDASQEELELAKLFLTKAGIDVDTYSSNSDLPMAARNMALIPTMYFHPDAIRKKWLVVCDDDTFFPNMHALIEKLQNYDHSTEMYIGALSEDSLAVQKHGSQAFGGAGVFLSVPMAKKIADHFDECASERKVEEANSQGDRLLRQCIQRHSDIQLTVLQDLWQLDTFGDPSGFYEWGTKPLSIHHYRSWHSVNPSDLTKIAYVCGEDCTLQRFQTFDNFIISGYSIAQYPGGITFDTKQVEKTFRAENDTDSNFDYKMGPQRASLAKTGKKLAWEMKEATIQEDGRVLQTYIRRANDTRWVDQDLQPLNDYDSVIELLWTPNK